ncbi:MAG: HAD family hydrolase [Bacteroidales bacterium]|nr:HAD family hydrolase [Clostridium sp.]MCM1204526.1 HAD family hydrolase [Bacteroidales bacterium]
MAQKIIFLDIDGTLTMPGSNEPPESALRAIREAQKEGHYVFLCTGRNYDMLSPLLKYGFDGVIASSGGYIVCGEDVIYDCPMTEEQKQSAMEILEKNGIYRTIECRDGSYTDEAFKEFLREHAAEGGNSELLRWREQIEKSLNILPMKEYRGQPVYKIVMMSRSREQLKEPQRILAPDFQFCIQDENKGGFINGEVVNREFDKGKAVKRVCSYFHIPIGDSVAVGDSMNDREMLEAAGFSICMGNGSEELKKLADYICPPVQEDGLQDAFRRSGIVHG